MSMEEDLTRLVRETVKVEVENHMRIRSSELIGRGGDVVLGGMGNLYLQPGTNKKAYYKGIEIGIGTGGLYLPLVGGTLTGDLNITTNINFYSGIKTGAIFSKKVSVETVDYYGIQINPYNTHGSDPGDLYIGDNVAAPGGGGILITDTGISLIPISTNDVKIVNSIMFQNPEGGYLGRSMLQNASTAPSVGKGGIYFDTDDNNVYVNKGTYAAPDWQLVGGSIVWGSITGTLSNQTDLQNALNAKLATVDHTKAAHDALDIDADTLDGYHAAAFAFVDGVALLAANNIFTGNKQYLLGAGGSEANYPQWLMKNTTYGSGYYNVISLDDSGYLILKGSEGMKLNSTLKADITMGTYKVTGMGAATTAGDAIRYEQVPGFALSSPSRSLDTVYQNTSGKPIICIVTITSVTQTSEYTYAWAYIGISSADSFVAGIDNISPGSYISKQDTLTFIVPNNYYYKVSKTTIGTSSVTLNSWKEF